MQSTDRVRTIHDRHRGRICGLCWSESGQYLLSVAWDGRVVVFDRLHDAIEAFHVTSARDEKGPQVMAGCWQGDDILLARPDGLSRLSVTGTPLSVGAVISPLKLVNAPRGRRLAAYEHDMEGRGTRFDVLLSMGRSPGELRKLDRQFQGIRSLAWSCDGGALAVLHDDGVSVVRGLDVGESWTVPGAPTEMAWIDDHRVAVACADANIRVYDLDSGPLPDQFPPDSTDILDLHRAPVVAISGACGSGWLASVDTDGVCAVWNEALECIFRHQFSLDPGRSHEFELALHPSEPELVVALRREVFHLRFQGAAAATPAPPSATNPVPPSEDAIVERVIAACALDGAARTHVDAVTEAWELHAVVSYDEFAFRTLVIRQVLQAINSLAAHGGEALRWLAQHGPHQLVIGIEELSFSLSSPAKPAREVRRQVLSLISRTLQPESQGSLEMGIAAMLSIAAQSAGETRDLHALAKGSLREHLPLLDVDMRRWVLGADRLASSKDPQLLATDLAHLASSLQRLIQHPPPRRPPDRAQTFAIVLKGGGAKGLAHVGALREIRRYCQCHHYAGTSAGAIVAVMAGAGFTDDELEQLFNGVDFAELIDESIIGRILNLLRRGGLYTADDLQLWIDREIAKKLRSPTQVRLGRMMTRTTVYACQGHERAVEFDSQNNPEEFASFAARCSMSIPIFFTPQFKSGWHVFDGGLHQNYPVEQLLGDPPKCRFIGLYLGDPTFQGRPKGLVANIYSAIFEANDWEQLEKHADHTVVIDVRPISTLDFDLTRDEKRFLYLSGQLAALDFLERKGVPLGERNDTPALREELTSLRDLVTSAKRQRKLRRRLVVLLLLLSVTAIYHETLGEWVGDWLYNLIGPRVTLVDVKTSQRAPPGAPSIGCYNKNFAPSPAHTLKPNLPGGTGWIHVGYLKDIGGDFQWGEGPYVKFINDALPSSKPDGIAKLDTIVLRVSRPVVMVDFGHVGDCKFATSPLEIPGGKIRPEDRTGVALPKGAVLKVQDVRVNHFVGDPLWVVWVRVRYDPLSAD